MLLQELNFHCYDIHNICHILYVSCLYLVGSLECINCDEGDKCKTGIRMGCNDGYMQVQNEETFTCKPCKTGNQQIFKNNFWQHRCWWRMWVTVYVAYNFKMFMAISRRCWLIIYLTKSSTSFFWHQHFKAIGIIEPSI